MSLSCPGCFATFEAFFEGGESPVLACRFCRTPLDEVTWEASNTGHEADASDLPQLTVTQYPFGELRAPPARRPRARARP